MQQQRSGFRRIIGSLRVGSLVLFLRIEFVYRRVVGLTWSVVLLSRRRSLSGIGRASALHGKVVIGDDVMMAPECVFYTRNHETSRLDVSMNQQGTTEERSILVGNDVWLGRRVMVMPGVIIGDHSIVAAGAVVTKSVPPYSIVAGVPGRVLRSRFDSRAI